MCEFKIKGYVARDKDPGVYSDLYLYYNKPTWDEKCQYWTSKSESIKTLPQEWFPELKYTDEPMEVELSIKQKEQWKQVSLHKTRL